ncbi:MAG: hypothetical protein ACR5K7_02060 [Symbiopectobacterium sp.]
MRITDSYPGASAQTMENTVTQIIEQSMTLARSSIRCTCHCKAVPVRHELP